MQAESVRVLVHWFMRAHTHRWRPVCCTQLHTQPAQPPLSLHTSSPGGDKVHEQIRDLVSFLTVGSSCLQTEITHQNGAFKDHLNQQNL